MLGAQPPCTDFNTSLSIPNDVTTYTHDALYSLLFELDENILYPYIRTNETKQTQMLLYKFQILHENRLIDEIVETHYQRKNDKEQHIGTSRPFRIEHPVNEYMIHLEIQHITIREEAHIWNSNFESYYLSELYSDHSILLQGEEIPIHKILVPHTLHYVEADTEPKTYKLLLKNFYHTPQYDLENHSVDELLDMVELANRYKTDVPTLWPPILTLLDAQNVYKIARTADKAGNTVILDACEKFIAQIAVKELSSTKLLEPDLMNAQEVSHQRKRKRTSDIPIALTLDLAMRGTPNMSIPTKVITRHTSRFASMLTSLAKYKTTSWVTLFDEFLPRNLMFLERARCYDQVFEALINAVDWEALGSTVLVTQVMKRCELLESDSGQLVVGALERALRKEKAMSWRETSEPS